ncbi:MAG TPA: ribosome maturation factor RimM [Fervidobacterium sp.]|jgi:16S rRNA processing protein RimM|nr:16S rRNA processing protein RimM [Fervidobacterium sp.]NLH38152.1 16S rRNA processing protein RimM [Thermotogaceae bacterium]MBP8657556.1 16S rRNA processing protein RimM [Fervidobacterium sp.]MBP9518500.1 16S rRNA processing protein RimM [Fervidobacterium sp.]HOK32979.1 ribosome maturation factor RimM [Fervidobacterium sp.]
MMKNLEDLLQDRVPLGILSNTHGLNGDLKLYPFSNSSDFLSTLTEAVAYNEEQKKFITVKFEKIRKARDHFIIHVVGINTISEAEKLKGFVVYVAKDVFPKSKDSEYYFFEIIDSDVFDESDNFLGTVRDIIETGSNDVIVVKNEKSEMLIPIIERYVLNIEKGKKRITVKVPEWLE